MTERELLEDIELELVRARAGSAPIRSRHTLAACDLLLELVRDRLKGIAYHRATHDYYEEEADELDELHDLGVVVLAGPPLKPKRLTLDEARAEFDRRQVAATITDAELAAARRGEGDR